MNDDLVLLYVEDEASIREEMIDILELDFEHIHVATNGQEGLEMFQKFHPDLIISDIQMPLMDGITMSQEILSIDPEAKIILTTAFNEQGYLEKAKEAGIKGYVNKPLNINELFEQIEAVLASKKE